MKYTRIYNNLNKTVQTEPDIIKVLTLNCYLFPHYIFQTKGNDNREKRAMQIYELVKNYDIVLLQEVFDTFWCRSWKNIFGNVPGMNALYSETNKALIGAGLFILSKYEFKDVGFIKYKNKPFCSKLINRGFLYCTVNVKGKDIHIINTHTAADAAHLDTKSAAEFRKLQLQEILDFKQEINKPNDIWIIGGDLNDKELPFTMFDDTYIKSLSETRDNTTHRLLPFCYDNTFKEGCMDYIITNRPQKRSAVINTLISDHYPVEAEIII